MAAKSLPMEIIANILSRLPVKPLLRFKCVSKSFYSLIESPAFVKLHLSETLLVSNHRRHLFLAYSSLSSAPLNDSPPFTFTELHQPLKLNSPTTKTPRVPSFFSQDPPPGIQILGSCNGVICICDSTRSHVFLYNPCTGSRRKLQLPPPPKWNINNSKIKGVYPDGDSYVYGLGYEVGSDDYKLLRMIQLCGPDNEVNNEAMVYSMRQNSWKRINDIPYNLMYRDHHHGVLVSEGLHYIVSEVAFEMNRKCIARFDVKTATFSLVDRPPKYKDEMGSWTCYLGELLGWLSFTVNYDFHGYADIWAMMEYGKKESWVKLFRLKKESSGLDIIQIRPIACSNDGEKILAELENRELGLYDMMRSHKMQGAKMIGRPDEDFNTGVFMESLVSVSLDDDKVPQPGEATMPKPPREPKKESGLSRVDDNLQPEAATRKPRKKNNLDNFLNVGFKLRL